MKKIFGIAITVWRCTFGITFKARKWKLTTTLHFNPKGEELIGIGLTIYVLGYNLVAAAGAEKDDE